VFIPYGLVTMSRNSAHALDCNKTQSSQRTRKGEMLYLRSASLALEVPENMSHHAEIM